MVALLVAVAAIVIVGHGAGATGAGVIEALLRPDPAAAAPVGASGNGEPSGEVAPGELPDPTTSPEEVREAADDILDDRQFQRPEPSLVDKALDWVSERIARVLERLTTGDGASLVGWAIMLGAIAAVVVLLVRFGRSVQRDPAGAAEVQVDRARTASQWDEEAERLEADGEWKLALRSRFRALVAVLVERGHVDDVPGRTTGEYRAEVAAGLPEAADAFAGATYLFEDAWYGDEPTGEVENARFRALAAEVLARAPRRRAAEVVTDAEAVPA